MTRTTAASRRTYAEAEFSEDTATVWLNRPERLNAASPALVHDMVSALETAISKKVRVIILAGRGRAFCAGDDLKEPVLDPDSTESTAHLENIQRITRLLRNPAVVSIAAVQGFALGAGLEFALGCDFVVAADDAVLGFPEVSVGLSVTGGISYLLPQAVGLPTARKMIMLGERFGAQTALGLGLVYAVSSPSELYTDVTALSRRIAGLPRLALRVAKESFESALDDRVEAALQREVQFARRTGKSDEPEAARKRFEARDEN